MLNVCCLIKQFARSFHTVIMENNKSASDISYDFNTADKMKHLLANTLLSTAQLKSGKSLLTNSE